MHYTEQMYEMVVAANAHTGLEKPSYKEREKLIAEYQWNSMNRVERISANLVKEVVSSETV
ncbi:hypothetical protein [Domibacillus aminovorans]|uniref:Uncharacterized protein n=1 Tax=Domibacillus aminovorans TaxID=29332 RepID=A0A177L3V6_9BACI|nr:hypothetical protein [Domibacillus aminovorans]OAH60094.1 hypothetical protein AWH49_17980 [Domibacillus aminovorans]